jgi:decaprenylphospho-beta-D-ribofuranose 2-oxidase
VHMGALHGWGRYPVIEADVVAGEDLERITRGAVLSRGLGRAYGDAALPPVGAAGPVAVTPRADRILALDPETGVLRAEAGLSLEDLTKVSLGRGFFTPVSPGTRFVTLGGMVASDIHGKGHHVDGTFGRAVRSLRMRVADGRVLDVSREVHPELFRATLGGMGLTGHILEVEVALQRIPSPWLYEESERYGTFAETFTALGEASRAFPMTVGWIDTSARGARRGRGIVIRGRWATPEEAPPDPPPLRAGPRFPFLFPSGLGNRATFALANAVWWHKHPRRAVKHVVGPPAFFWQLDLARDWNRGYGRRGFTQYQCVLPTDLAVFEALLERFQQLGGTSFVTVLKDCGEQGEGLLSFPKRGTSLAVDIPIRSVEETARLVAGLDAFVVAHGGRVYLAKDAFTSAEMFRRMYPEWEAFQRVRDEWDPERRLRSALSVRLLGDEACRRGAPPEAP